MRPRRGSVMYDAARDIFTNTADPPSSTKDAAAEEAIEADAASTENDNQRGSPNETEATNNAAAAAPSEPQPDDSMPDGERKKRKHSPSVEPKSPRPASAQASEPDDKQQQQQQSDSTNDSANKRQKTSPAPPSDSAAPKPMTAANLASIPRIKKAPTTSGTQQPSRSGRDVDGSSAAARRRSRSPEKDSVYSRRRDRSSPQPTARRSRSPKPISRSPTPPARSPPQKRRRPGATARVNTADTEAVRQRQLEREQQQSSQAQAEAVARGVHDVVRQHYNAVPQRGKEWRKTDSLIKGLRSLNNWIKSAIIQKFSPNESYAPGAREHGYNKDENRERGLLVLDIGCGKGGDLQKWHAAPQHVDLYVGLDPAEVSINQARDRYGSMNKGNRGFRDRRNLFQGNFIVKDCYGEWLGDVPIVQEVGIDPAVGPDGRGPKRFGGGGFDVVTMMFCMHYAFESEAKARMMLRNVAGSLRKGGRFIGVIPNSDVLTAHVTEYNAKRGIKTPEKSPEEDSDDDWDPEKTLDTKADGKATANGEPGDSAASAELKNPEGETNDVPSSNSVAEEDTLTWGNSLYSIKFPHPTKLPQDGVFRPPFGWKYFYFLEEAVEEIPEYVVPWEAFRALAVEFDLELEYRRPFNEVWEAEKDDPVLGPLSERMGVRERGGGKVLVTDEEMDAAGLYVAFCFTKVGT